MKYTLMFSGVTVVVATKIVEAKDEKDAYDKGRQIVVDYEEGKKHLSWSTESDNEDVDDVRVEVLGST